MTIKEITVNDLRSMKAREGLIIQGCGGDLKEWVNGINEHLTINNVLKNGATLDDVSKFEYKGKTNLLFGLDNENVDLGKLALWRIATVREFGSSWLSDFVENRLGGFESVFSQKPCCPLIGEDGNIFNLMGVASKTLKDNNMEKEAEEMCDRIKESGDYYSALGIIGEYVDITSAEVIANIGGMIID